MANTMSDSEVEQYDKMLRTRTLTAGRWLALALAIKTMACKDSPLTIVRDENLEGDWDQPVIRMNNFMLTTRTKCDDNGHATVPELCEVWRLREFYDNDTGYRGFEITANQPVLSHYGASEAIAAMIGLALADYTTDALFAAEEAVTPDPDL
jgi:hypothetical protein